MKRMLQFFQWLKTLWYKGFPKKSELKKDSATDGLTTNTAVNPTLTNRIKDVFNTPASLKFKNNRRVTRGRQFYFLNNKKMY